MSKPDPAAEDQGIIYRNPGITASIATVLIAVIFIGLLYAATRHG